MTRKLRISYLVILTSAILTSGTLSPQETAPGALTGILRSPDGQPLNGILVKARLDDSNSTVYVFTDEKGRYQFPKLPAGRYQINVGKNIETVMVSHGPTTQDFVIELGLEFFRQTTGASWARLLPGTEEEKKALFKNCGSCHSYWRLLNRAGLDAEAWGAVGKKMAALTAAGVPRASDQASRVDTSEPNFTELKQYLARVINSELTKREILKALVRPTGEASRAVFTEWDLSAEVGETGLVRADSKGSVWCTIVTPDGRDGMGRLDTETGEFKIFPSLLRDAAFQDVLEDSEGHLWITVARANKIMKFDPHSFRYVKTWDIPNDLGTRSVHTGDWDKEGNFWATLTIGEGHVIKLEPSTGKIQAYRTPTPQPDAYGLKTDHQGDIWLTYLRKNKLAKIDPRTGDIKEFNVPTADAGPRRLQLDSRGRLWFTESYADKIGMLDPASLQWQEFDIGVQGGSPIFIKIDRSDKVWFNLLSANSIVRFDPVTEKFTSFLLPEPITFSRDAAFDYSTEPFGVVYAHAPQGNTTPKIGRMYVRPPEELK